MIARLLGGLGLFLLGMLLMTDGLRALAGESLRRVLVRFTGGPFRAVGSGALITAIVQSSSATTLATLGFVSAGLLTFPQALGVVYGANLGTTMTGWIVALVGLRMDVAAVAFPLIGMGALLRLFTRDRWAQAGLATAGFGLLFAGIDTLQAGMADLAAHVRPADLPPDTLAGRALLVAAGTAITVVLQSSSAAMTATLAAVHGGALSVPQGAALVVGHNIGTTVTAVLAAVGGTVPAKRTAAGHVLFNVLTGAIAFVALEPFVRLVEWSSARLGRTAAAEEVAAFHTAFNVLGVVLLLPATARLARALERLIPDRGAPLTRHLDRSVRGVPPVAVEAVRRCLCAAAAEMLDALRVILRPAQPPAEEEDARRRIHDAAAALAEAERFLDSVPAAGVTAEQRRRRLAVLHALDHLRRLAGAAVEPHHPEDEAGEPALVEAARRLDACALGALVPLREGREEAFAEGLAGLSADLARTRREQRARVLERNADGSLPSERAERLLESARWLDRLAYHAWRALLHLGDPSVAADDGGERAEAHPGAGARG